MREFLLRWTLLTDDLRSQGSEQGGEIMIAHKKTAEDQLELFSSGAKNKSKKTKKVDYYNKNHQKNLLMFFSRTKQVLVKLCQI